jgi:hypothetical protein
LKLVATKGDNFARNVAVTDESGATVSLSGASAELRIDGVFSKTFSGLSGASFAVELEPDEWTDVPSGFYAYAIDLTEGDGSSWEVERGELHVLPAIAGE